MGDLRPISERWVSCNYHLREIDAQCNLLYISTILCRNDKVKENNSNYPDTRFGQLTSVDGEEFLVIRGHYHLTLSPASYLDGPGGRLRPRWYL